MELFNDEELASCAWKTHCNYASQAVHLIQKLTSSHTSFADFYIEICDYYDNLSFNAYGHFKHWKHY